ncbi:hypothetical protein N9B94_05025 [Verrucomicrobia bacterium]|nr:hypothetical protein [Verrucomicrobiota bacterium]
MSEVPFKDVVHAATGREVLPVRSDDPFIKETLLPVLSVSLNRVLLSMNKADNPAHNRKRINEVSGDFEKAIRESLDSVEGFECNFAKNASGKSQRSGYPDLVLRHEAGRVIYLDPKVFKATSKSSSFRTFYYEPKNETNKILEDAHHLIIGIAHEGKVDGLWHYRSWELVDVSELKVKLKAEFQSSNRELYGKEPLMKQ